MIIAIAAIDINSGIGYQGKLLEKIPEDMQYFKALTMGHPIIMGRKTYESFPKRPLPGRENIVISSQKSGISAAAGLDVVSMEEALQYAIEKSRHQQDVYIIGGASIYEQFLPYCDIIYLTHIYEEHDNVDAYFPLVSLREWECYAKSDVHLHDGIPYQFKSYKRLQH